MLLPLLGAGVDVVERKCSALPKFQPQEKCSTSDNTMLYATVAILAGDMAASLVGALPGIGVAAAWATLDIVDSFQDTNDMSECLEEKLLNDMDKSEYKKYIAKYDGYRSTYGKIQVQASNNSSRLVGTTHGLVDKMREDAALFKYAASRGMAGLYYAMPAFASLHFMAYEETLVLTTSSEDIDELRKEYGDMILYYSQIAFRLWRKARDLRCKSSKSCRTEMAPYHCYIHTWLELAVKLGAQEAADYITDALNGLPIRDGDTVSFKSIFAEGDVSWKYEGWWDPGSWISGPENKSKYVYLRGCPGDYMTRDVTKCKDERWKIVGSSAGGIISNNGIVGIKTDDSSSYWLSLKDVEKCKRRCSRSGPGPCPKYILECSVPWWKTEKTCGEGKNWRPDYGNTCSREKFTLKREGHHTDNTIENGDFVNIHWRGDCRKDVNNAWIKKCNSVDTKFWYGPFEIINSGNLTVETNNWSSQPTLPYNEE